MGTVVLPHNPQDDSSSQGSAQSAINTAQDSARRTESTAQGSAQSEIATAQGSARSGLTEQRNEEFVRLFVVHQRQVFAFILTLLPNRSDAEDVLQETSAVLWRRFDEFQFGTNFAAWACGVAKLQVFAFLRQKKAAVAFNDSFVDLVADDALQRGNELDSRYQAMQHCLEKLSTKDRQLVQQRYGEEQSVVEIAKIVGRSVEGLYKAFHRIRASLMQCVDRTLAKEGSR